MSDFPSETFIEAKVTYTNEVGGKIVIVENVPARVCVETGEQLFSPETVETLHRIINGDRSPTRIITAKVFEFAA